MVHHLNREAMKLVAALVVPGDNVEFVAENTGVEEMNFEAKVRCADKIIEDILTPEEVMSIQQDKLLSEEQMRMKKAEEKKEGTRERVKLLRE